MGYDGLHLAAALGDEVLAPVAHQVEKEVDLVVWLRIAEEQTEQDHLREVILAVVVLVFLLHLEEISALEHLLHGVRPIAVIKVQDL